MNRRKMPVTVNGEAVEDSLIADEERSLRPQLIKAMPEEPRAVIDARAREWARDNVVDQILLRQAVQADPDLVTQLVAKLARPKSKEITEYYRKNRQSFYGPEMVHAVHLLAKVDEQTDDATALERMRGVDSGLRNGGRFLAVEGIEDLGYFPRGRMVPEFEAVVFALQPGQTSGIFRTAFGYHIAHVVGRRPDGIPDLNAVWGDVEKVLMRQKQRRAVDRYIDQLRTKADIRVE